MPEKSGTEAPQIYSPKSLREAILILLIIIMIEVLRPIAELANEIEPYLNEAEAKARAAGYRLALYRRVIARD